MKAKYDYSLLRIDYPKRLPYAKDFIRVICSIHGEFKINLFRHRNSKYGCGLCNKYKPKGYWTKERCIDDALLYTTKKDWGLNSRGHQHAVKNGWIDICTRHMIQFQKPHGYWTKQQCLIEAKKYKTRTELETKAKGAYGAAKKFGWLDVICSHMPKRKQRRRKWTLAICKKDALKYTTRTDWYLKSMGAYCAAKNSKWLTTCCKHMSNPSLKWTKELCRLEALKYTTKWEWGKNSPTSYSKSHDNGWVKNFTKHMVSGYKGRMKQIFN